MWPSAFWLSCSVAILQANFFCLSFGWQLRKGSPGSYWKLIIHGTEDEMGRAASQIIVNLWAGANEPEADRESVWCYDPTVIPPSVLIGAEWPYSAVLMCGVLYTCMVQGDCSV
jgi:hypothetical protein